jgi:hypothetical protein
MSLVVVPLIFTVIQKNTSLKKLFENLSSPQKVTDSDNNTRTTTTPEFKPCPTPGILGQ